MLSKKIQKALNDQISNEAYAFNYYLTMASWCEVKGFQGSSTFLYEQAKGEHQHMMKLFHYVNEAGGHALAPTLEKVPHTFENLSEIFHLIEHHERQMTGKINHLVDLCLVEKDYSSFNFLQWYVAEQHEEERLFKSILDRIKIIAVDEKGYFHIDKEIGQMVKSREA